MSEDYGPLLAAAAKAQGIEVDAVVLSSTNPETAPLAESTATELRAGGTAAIVGAPGSTLLQLQVEARSVVAAHADAVLAATAR